MTSPVTPAVSVVVPTYRSSSTLRLLADEIASSIGDRYEPWELVLVDDASPDSTWQAIKDLAASDTRIRGIRLGRNSGQHVATLAGLQAARAPIIVTIDDDLQQPPEAIPDLISSLSDETPIVYGPPRQPDESLRQRLGPPAKRLIGRLVGWPHVEHIVSFRAMRASLVDQLPRTADRGFILDVYLSWLVPGFGVVPVDHRPREHGQSGYRVWDLAGMVLDAVVAYGGPRLRLVGLAGAAAGAIGGIVAAGASAKALSGSQSWRSAAVPAAIALSGLNLAATTIVLEHSVRTQVRTAGQSAYWVRETVNLGS